jgi:thiol-disulfide isomerase/thioredoxin
MAILAAVILAGCDTGSGQPTNRISSEDGKSPLDRVDLTPASYATIDTALTENKGKVVVIDVWATWCGPCRQRFPHLVDLHRKYAAKGLVCMSLSIDSPDDKPYVQRFLEEHEASFPNFIWADPKQLEDRKKLGARLRLGGSIPHLVVFSRTGEFVYGGYEKSPDEVEDLVEHLLARK